jgi:hypothetical protein
MIDLQSKTQLTPVRYTIDITDDLDADVLYDHAEGRYLNIEQVADRLNGLEAENKELKRELLTINRRSADSDKELVNQIIGDGQRIRELVAALKQYATKDNWNQKDMQSGHFDWFMLGNAGWDIAEAALSPAARRVGAERG